MMAMGVWLVQIPLAHKTKARDSTLLDMEEERLVAIGLSLNKIYRASGDFSVNCASVGGTVDLDLGRCLAASGFHDVGVFCLRMRAGFSLLGKPSAERRNLQFTARGFQQSPLSTRFGRSEYRPGKFSL